MKRALEFVDRHRRRRPSVRVFVLCVVVALAIPASLGGYLISRQYSQSASVLFGADEDEPDRVHLTAWVTRVDVIAQRIQVIVTNLEPVGAVQGPDGNFAEDAVLETNSLGSVATAVRAGEALPNIEQEFALSGVVTDFPFDRYTALMAFRLTGADGREVPIAVNIESTDPFFSVESVYDAEQSEWLNIDLGVERSSSTVVFGVYIMILMLGLALAAAVLAYFVIRSRQGLVFSAYSVMAGLLFAMIPLRNAVPGDPPIGSVIDFMSFFIAEAVISVCLITSVMIGYRRQLEIDEARGISESTW